MKAKPQEKIPKPTDPSTRGHWNEMNRKQRRETMRKIESEDLSLEVVHPHAAGIQHRERQIGQLKWKAAKLGFRVVEAAA